MKKGNILLLFFQLALACTLKGQNIGFTQYFNYLFYSDPSQTGNGDYDYRVSALYRQQWESIEAEFSTFAVSGDLRLGNVFSRQDSWGVGVYLLDDHLGGDIMQNQQVGVALAYHIHPDFQARHQLSFGVNVDYVFSSLDFGSLVFESQYQGFFLQPDVASGESFANDRIKNLDLGMGVSYRFALNQKTNLGVSLASYGFINRQENFISDSDSTQYNHSEWLARGFYSYQLSPKVGVESHAQVISQSNVSGVMLGLIGHYTPFPAKPIRLSLGMFRQFDVAYVAYGGLSYKNYEVNISYDFASVPLNTLREINGLSRPGSFEVTFNFKGFKKTAPSTRTVPCRIF